MTSDAASSACVGGMDTVAIGIALADALNRERALTPVESGWVAVLTGKAPSRRPLRRWTAAQDASLLDLIRDGLTASEIGTRIGRSADAIHTRVKRLKLKESAHDSRR